METYEQLEHVNVLCVQRPHVAQVYVGSSLKQALKDVMAIIIHHCTRQFQNQKQRTVYEGMCEHHSLLRLFVECMK